MIEGISDTQKYLLDYRAEQTSFCGNGIDPSGRVANEPWSETLCEAGMRTRGEWKADSGSEIARLGPDASTVDA